MAETTEQPNSSPESSPSSQDFSSPEDFLLFSARNGLLRNVHDLLLQHNTGEITLDVNKIGSKKANRGWSALHLAAYFGHCDVVDVLAQAGANVNIVNHVGDTPLHQAAFTGRKEVVLCLLRHEADVHLVNAEGHTPQTLAKTVEISNMIKAAVSSDLKLVEDKFLTAARYGDIGTLTELMLRSVPPNKNCTDIFGNTALHIAAQRDRKDVAIFLLQHGIDTALKNSKGQKANSLARSVHMKQLLGVRPQKDHQTLPQRWEGPVAKKSKLMGYRVFWVVLERGVLSYFRNRGDASTGVKRKGMKYLDQARLTPEASSKSEFTINFSDGTTHRLAVEVVNGSTVNRQKLLNALQDHVAYSTHYTCQGGDFIDDDKEDDQPAASSMFDALQTARAHHEVLEDGVAQMAVLFNSFHDEKQLSKPANLQAIRQKMHLVLQSSRETSHSLSNCLSTFTHQEEVRKLQLKEEMEKSRVLEEALHALATEHHEMERSLGSHLSLNKIYDTDDDEFYDCTDEEDANIDDARARTNSYNSDNFEDAHSFDDASFHTVNGEGSDPGATLLAETHSVSESGDHCQEIGKSRTKSARKSKKECIGSSLQKVKSNRGVSGSSSFIARGKRSPTVPCDHVF